MYCSVLQYIAVYSNVFAVWRYVGGFAVCLWCVAVCCSVLQCIVVYCSLFAVCLKRVAVHLQFVCSLFAVYCSDLQCIAWCLQCVCSAFPSICRLFVLCCSVSLWTKIFFRMIWSEYVTVFLQCVALRCSTFAVCCSLYLSILTVDNGVFWTFYTFVRICDTHVCFQGLGSKYPKLRQKWHRSKKLRRDE